ncbi:cation transport ATPase [Saccharomonospora azurea SZMC 14600]|nr:cation transport ATPase [Saccharomonospora azurea SZMC 14600]
MAGVVEHLARRALLHHLTPVHHRDPLAGLRQHTQVVADHDEPDAALGDEVAQQPQHLVLHHHVQSSGRLVGHDELRFARQRHRDHDALFLPAGQLVRVGVRTFRGQVHLPQQLGHAVLRGPVRGGVQPDRLGDLLPHGAHRVQRVHRALEHDRRRRPAHRAQPAPPHRVDVLAVQQHLAGDGRGLRQQPQQAHRHGGLARAGLARDAQRLTRSQREVDVAHRGYLAARGAVGDPEVAQPEQGGLRRLRRHHCPLNLGLSTVSNARPTSVKHNTITTIASPGGSRYHQAPALTEPDDNADCNIEPHDTALGSPNPRNDSVDSAMIELPTTSVVFASTSGSTDGSTCRPRMWAWPPPSARARSTNGLLSIVRVCARTSRAVAGHDVTPTASTMVAMPCGNTVDSAIASTSDGSTRKKSVKRSSTLDTQPPKCPAASPTRVPMTTDRIVAANPTSSDTRAPHSVSSSTERPSTSVPRRNSRLGGSSGVPGAVVTFRSAASVNSGAVTASTTTAASTPNPISPPRCPRNSLHTDATAARRRCHTGEVMTHAPSGPAPGTAVPRPGSSAAPIPPAPRTRPAATAGRDPATPGTSTTPGPATRTPSRPSPCPTRPCRTAGTPTSPSATARSAPRAAAARGRRASPSRARS